MDSTAFISEARRESLRSNCAKQRLGVVIVKDGEVVSRGWNTCRCSGVARTMTVRTDQCERTGVPTGTGYALSKPVHAEVSALLHIRPERDAGDFERCIATEESHEGLVAELFTAQERERLRGSVMYVSGHTYVCDACQKWCDLLGIREIVFDK